MTETKKYDENDTPWYAVVGGLIASLCASTVVSNLVKSNANMPSSFKNRIVLAIGASAVAGAVSSFAGKQVETDICEASSFAKGFIGVIKDYRKEKDHAGRDSERDA